MAMSPLHPTPLLPLLLPRRPPCYLPLIAAAPASQKRLLLQLSCTRGAANALLLGSAAHVSLTDTSSGCVNVHRTSVFPRLPEQLRGLISPISTIIMHTRCCKCVITGTRCPCELFHLRCQIDKDRILKRWVEDRLTPEE